MKRVLAAMCVALHLGCSNDTGTSPSTVDEAALTAEIFAGTLSVGGLRFYSFTVPANSAFSVLLASLATAPGAPLPDLQVGIGIGTPAGTSCAVRESIATTPSLVTQFHSWATEGIHCVAIYDLGYLREPVSFAIRLTHN
jgi:hypothetical protein